MPRGGPGAAEGAGRRKPTGEAGRAEWRGGRRGARGRGGPSVLWDAAVEWRWARDFEQTRVCVSEAPPPPRLLGAQGARREEAAAPPALVSVSHRGGGIWAGGKGRQPPLRVLARAEGTEPPPPGAGLVGPGREREPTSWGSSRPTPGPQGAGVSSRVGPFPPAPGRAAVTRQPALPGGLEDGLPRLLTRTVRGPRIRPCRPRVSGNRFCCCVILYQPLLSLLPAAPFFLRPFVWCLLRECPFSSRSPPAKCHNVPEVHGGRERAGA